MTQEMKLLMAMCDAMGLEVTTIIDYQPRKETETGARHWNDGYSGRDRHLSATAGRIDIDEDGMRTSLLKAPIVDYKVTSKELEA